MRYFGKEQLQELLTTLGANKLRTALTGFAVGWGILLLVVLLSAGTGFNNGITETYRSIGSNTETVDFEIGWVTIPVNGHTEWSVPKFTESDMKFLAEANASVIRLATPISNAYGLTLEGGGTRESARAIGVRKEYAQIQQLRMVVPGSRFINDKDELETRKVVILPQFYATALFGDAEKALGQKVLIKQIGFTVVGVCKDYYGRWTPLVMPLSTMRLLHLNTWDTPEHISSVRMLCPSIKTEAQVDSLKAVFVRQLAPRLGTSPEDKDVVYLSSEAVSNATMGKVLGGIEIFLWIVGLSTLIIGLVGVINIMQITVTERRREIGVRKALGAQPKDIIAMILTESVIVTLIAGLAGLVVGVAIMAGVDHVVTTMGIGDLAKSGDGNMNGILFLHPVIRLDTAIGAILVMLIGGVLAGYLPARKAVRVPVVEAMRN